MPRSFSRLHRNKPLVLESQGDAQEQYIQNSGGSQGETERLMKGKHVRKSDLLGTARVNDMGEKEIVGTVGTARERVVKVIDCERRRDREEIWF